MLVVVEVGEESARRPLAAGQRQARARPQQRLAVGEQEDVRAHDVGLALAQPEDAQRHPGLARRDREHDRRAVALVLSEGSRTRRVEPGGHEDGTTARVEVEHLGRVGRQQETVVDGPLADRLPAAAQDGDVEGVDLGLEDHLRRGGGLRDPVERQRLRDGRLHLALESLQGPVAAAFHLGGDAR